MNENYRNSKQITNYCNERFGMQMNAINLDGRGVHIVKQSEDIFKYLSKLFLTVQKQGISAIIVKNMEEAKTLLYELKEYSNKMHDLTNGSFEIHRTRWNILTVEQAKGLEFGTVMVLSEHMSQNEKYIAYTRALDELFIYDYHFMINAAALESDATSPEENNNNNKTVKKKKATKKKDYSNSPLRKFFEDANCRVKDTRLDGGSLLWVIGKKEEIEPIIKEATKQFSVTGSYSVSKEIGNKEGWYTKSKK